MPGTLELSEERKQKMCVATGFGTTSELLALAFALAFLFFVYLFILLFFLNFYLSKFLFNFTASASAGMKIFFTFFIMHNKLQCNKRIRYVM